MTTFHLIRHAAHDLLDRALAGRMPGVSLNAAGRRAAERLAERLADVPFAAIYSSPLERARETAAPLAARHGLALRIEPALDEIDFGGWTGRALAELHGQEAWQRFNSFRSGTPIPSGERMLDVQARIVAAMQRLGERHPDGEVALVSHGDVLKSALAYHLGVPLDLFQRIEVAPASHSIVVLAAHGPKILLING